MVIIFRNYSGLGYRSLISVTYNDLPKDWLALVIDWECSRYTKPQAQLNARETMEQKHPETREIVEPILKQLNL